jgi:hypothetical protein
MYLGLVWYEGGEKKRGERMLPAVTSAHIFLFGIQGKVRPSAIEYRIQPRNLLPITLFFLCRFYFLDPTLTDCV